MYLFFKIFSQKIKLIFDFIKLKNKKKKTFVKKKNYINNINFKVLKDNSFFFLTKKFFSPPPPPPPRYSYNNELSKPGLNLKGALTRENEGRREDRI